MFQFTLHTTDPHCAARCGTLQTPHATIQTPVFMPVGTQATVKSISPQELAECGCAIILANTYHLHLRPGESLIKDAGGLHRFEHWNGAMLTDSGGFQVFSLRDISSISDDGVWFQSHIDGSRHHFSPEAVMEIQHALGADIIMMFDECPPAKSEIHVIKKAVTRTIEWARRCVEHHAKTPCHFGYEQALFGIIQGGTIPELREFCARELVAMELPGYAIGGCAVGESMVEMYTTVGQTAALLPQNKPRYLMGVGKPQDILEAIERGVDMFDCVLPTRNGRNGSVFTWAGKVNIKNACYTRDFDSPLDPACCCATCRTFSRSYLRHLFMAKEILAIRAFTLHNIFFFQELMRQARIRIADGTFLPWKQELVSRWRSEKLDGE